MRKKMIIATSVTLAVAVCQANWTDQLTVTSSDVTNAFAVLAWSAPNSGSSTLVCRATSPGGPYAEIASLDDAQTTWTDTDIELSIRYYYRLRELRDDSGTFVKEEPGPHVSYIPLMSIERDWSDRTKVKPGMTLLGTHYSFYGWGVDKMFDNEANTCPDTTSAYPNPAVGVNLGKPYCIQSIRFMARSQWMGLNGVELRGSNDTLNYTNHFTRLVTFAGEIGGQLVPMQTETLEPFQCVFVQRPDENSYHGHVSELELFGWDPDILNGIFKAPDSVTLADAQGFGIVQLDWELGTQQDAYRIERSTDGKNWTPLGTTENAWFLDTAPNIGIKMFYRVVAVQDDPAEEAFSDIYSVIASAKDPDVVPPPPSGLSVTCSDITNTFAVLAWSNPPLLTTLVYRATNRFGPYTCIAQICGGQTTWTDTSATPSVRYYYRISAQWDDGSGPPAESEQGPYVTYLPLIPIERDWNDRTKIKQGMTLIGTHYSHWGWGVDRIFDANLGNCADIIINIHTNPAIGVNLGKPYCIQTVRFAGYNGWWRNLNGMELRGSNDELYYTNNFTRLLTFAGVTEGGKLFTLQTETQEPFQCIFAQRPEEDESGHIAELELFGWDPDILNSVLQGPDPVNLTLEPGRVLLDWVPGPLQSACRIERSTDGKNWTPLGTTLGGSFADRNPLVGGQAFYRVVAVQNFPPAEAYSDVYPAVALPGLGTKLMIK